MANIKSMQKGVEDPAWIRVTEILTMCCVPVALKAAIRLNVMEILAQENSELSSKEIVVLIGKEKGESSISNPTADIALDRILRVLASQGLLSSSLQYDEAHMPVRKYGLNAASRYLASGDAGAPSLAALSLFGLHKAFTDTWQFLDQAVIEGGQPFTLAHGQNAFLFGKANPEFDRLFHTAMANQSTLFNRFLLQSYHGFLGVNTLVDVGGGMGACLHAIVSKYPHIKGINFDQPHVVASAPSYTGVNHIGGDMFENIPQGDAIFMKWILHDWSDELCVKILKNCYKALPTNGKVIIVEAILSPEVETTPTAHINYNLDLFMFTYFPGGKERTKQELQKISIASGFKNLQIITQVNEFFVIELHKI